jgi:hypothetical protein
MSAQQHAQPSLRATLAARTDRCTGPVSFLSELAGDWLAGAPLRREPFNLIIVTDVGPDPDDAKALLIAATLHKQRLVNLRAVIANGGHQARERAALARSLLDLTGGKDVPVGVGTQGREYGPMPHEYSLMGFAEALAGAPSEGERDAAHAGPTAAAGRISAGHALFVETLRRMPAGSVRVVCISSLRDFADVIEQHAELVLAKVRALARCRICAQAVVRAGLRRALAAPSPSPERWRSAHARPPARPRARAAARAGASLSGAHGGDPGRSRALHHGGGRLGARHLGQQRV